MYDSLSYPTATGKFLLSMTGFEDGQAYIKVTDIYGTQVYNREQYLSRGSGVIPIDLGQNKANGIYFIQVMQKDRVAVVKLMKK